MKRILAIALLAASFPASAALVCSNDEYSETGVWRVGDAATVLDQIDSIPSDAVWCQASGAELTYIKKNFTGLHGRNGTSLDGFTLSTWSGADAVFIIENL
jgi:hypothetical protein